ncbi:MAG: UDP-N-acetylglucosamine 1-carboxyvinyltransferase [Candidatus Shapirobacteria bacterium]|nr:UDP-N-acetylglucosamine 1-carboxyvinyltransferase [Candidatus Shapirobacteria bacterium]
MNKESKDYIRITGGKSLSGEIELRGAKNSVPKEMVATLLTTETCNLSNVANIRDVDLVGEMLEVYGASVTQPTGTSFQISTENITQQSAEVITEFAGKSRIPILFSGPLLHRFGETIIPGLGGCAIGERPINFHVDALRQMGAEVIEKDGCTLLKAKKLHGTKLRLEYPSVGATEQVVMSAVLAEGVTELKNSAVEPEIIDLICLLQKMGAIISVDTDRTIKILGVDKLRGYDHTAIPDRLEAASWACVALATRGEIKVKHARQQDMITFLNKYRQVGGEFDVVEDGIRFWRQKEVLSPVALETDVHPGFQTDWQQPFVLALTQANGVSVIHETVYEDRFGYTRAINQMGGQIQLFRECLGSVQCRFGQKNHLHSAVVVGPQKLRAADITVPDLRAGFTYVAAALVAEGTSQINNINLINRGYEDFETKLRKIGANIES